MAPVFNMVKDVNPSKTLWALKLRLVRAYEIPAYGNRGGTFSYETIFRDREGSTIHGSIRRPHIEKFMGMLNEGSLYIISDFIVADNSLKYKSSMHKYKFNFYRKTKVHEIEDETFPLTLYDFKPYTEILANQIDESHLFDVIGRLVSIQPPQIKELRDGPKRLMEIVLEDLEKHRITCTLWDDFIDRILPLMDEDSPNPIVIVLQMCRAKFWKNEVKISNTYYVTKMIINGSDQESVDFRRSFENNVDGGITITTLSTFSGSRVSDEFESGKAIVTTLEQLAEICGVGSYWVYCKIVAVVNDDDCWYFSCNRCSKKLIDESGVFFCPKCDQSSATGNYRYRIDLRVVDESGIALLTLWDKESTNLIGKVASELREKMLGKKNLDDKIPDEIEALVDTKVLFKVATKDPNSSNYKAGTYTVLKLTTDQDIIARYCASFINSQESDLLSKLKYIDAESDVQKNYSSEDEVATPDKLSKKIVEVVEVFENSQVKRKLDDEFSTSIKKLKTFIKKEK